MKQIPILSALLLGSAIPESAAELSHADRTRVNEILEDAPDGKLKGVIDRAGGEQAALVLPNGLRVPFESVNLKGSVDPRVNGLPAVVNVGEMAEDGKRSAEVIPLPGVDALEEAKEKMGERFPRLNRQLATLDQARRDLIEPDAAPPDLRQLGKDIDLAKAEVVSASIAIHKDPSLPPEERKELSEQLCTALAKLELDRKAIYQRPDNYSPAIYRKIYDNSRAVVATSRKGMPADGSGALVGRDLVLTCMHNVEEHGVDQIEIWFDHERDEQQARPLRKFPVDRIVHSGQPYGPCKEPLDWVLLAVGRNSEGRRPSDYTEEGDTDEPRPLYPPLALSTSLVSRHDAIYVIGHPAGQPKTVHDNSFVLFPFATTEKGLHTLKMSVCGLIHTAAEDSGHEGTHGEHDEWLRQLEQSYVALDGSSPRQYRNFPARRRMHPTIGADCDTYHGNSGSPAFSRHSNAVIGILFEGEPDSQASYAGSWRRHEAIAPITVVIEQMNRDQSDWLTKYSVSIQ